MGKTAVVERGYSTEYSAHRDLIYRYAKRGYGRLIDGGVSIEFEDVFQEMSLIYVKAAAGYNPERGITFSAYLGRAIWNDFNKYAEKLLIDACGECRSKKSYDEFDHKRAEVSGIEYENKPDRSRTFFGTTSIEDLVSDSDESPYEFLSGSARTPEEEYINSRVFYDGMAELPVVERVVVGKLMSETIKRGPRTMQQIMVDMNMTDRQIEQSRARIRKAFA